MMELIPAGIRGIMRGLAIADVLKRVFDLRQAGRSEEAFASTAKSCRKSPLHSKT